jgi:hypothetical protein
METMSYAEITALFNAIPVADEPVSADRLVELMNEMPPVRVDLDDAGKPESIDVTGLVLRTVEALSVVVRYAAAHTGQSVEAVLFDLRTQLEA